MNKSLKRCSWANGDLYIAYHDDEWGVPVHDDRHLFEMIILEGAQTVTTPRAPNKGSMPGYAKMTDQEIADVTNYIRNSWGNQAPAVTAAQVTDLRKTTDPTSDQVIILKMR